MLKLSIYIYISRRHSVRLSDRQDESAAAEVMPTSREVDATLEGVPESSQPGDVLSAEVSRKIRGRQDAESGSDLLPWFRCCS